MEKSRNVFMDYCYCCCCCWIGWSISFNWNLMCVFVCFPSYVGLYVINKSIHERILCDTQNPVCVCIKNRQITAVTNTTKKWNSWKADERKRKKIGIVSTHWKRKKLYRHIEIYTIFDCELHSLDYILSVAFSFVWFFF